MDLTVVINVMVQLFLVMGLGYFMMKKSILDREILKKFNYIVLSITTPALIFASVCGENDASADVVLYVAAVAFAFYLILPVVAFVLIKILRIKKPRQGLFIFMTIFSNVGFIGFPVMKSIFGNTAVFYTAIFNLMFNFEVFTLGVLLINRDKGEKATIDFRNLINPGVISSVLAIIIYFANLQMPSILISTAEMVGGMTTPLAMIIIGANLALMDIKEVFNELIVYPYTLIKQIILPVIAFPVIAYFIKDPLIQGITLVNLAMPVGNSAVLFATQYDHDVSLAAKTVFITTLFSVFTIPLIVGLFLA